MHIGRALTYIHSGDVNNRMAGSGSQKRDKKGEQAGSPGSEDVCTK